MDQKRFMTTAFGIATFRRWVSVLVLLGFCGSLSAQSVIPLYPDGRVPNSKPTLILNDTVVLRSPSTGRDTMILIPRTIMPTLTVFQPSADKRTGMAVIICSGGSYQRVLDKAEGIPAAQLLAKAGITAFVLRYRVPRSDLMTNKENVPMQDLQKAIQYVREHAGDYRIDKSSVGVMGFSAAGHLVSTVCTHLGDIFIENPGLTNLRPNFMILVYPVISFADKLTHLESRNNLIGPDITAEKALNYSNELHVDTATPPAFIVHAIDDGIVRVENSLYFEAALEQHHIPAELFLYAKGGHAFGVYNPFASVQWIDACISWIKTRQWMPQQ